MKNIKAIIALLIAVVILALSSFSVFSSTEPEPINMAVLGDSIASGYGLEDMDDSYSTIIGEEKYYTVINSAVPGHTTTDLLWVVCHDEDARQSLESAHLVVISIGGNDLLHLLGNSDTTVLFDILTKGIQSQYVKSMAANAQEKLLYSCMEIRSLNPDVPIILQTQYNPLYAHEQYKQFASIADKLAPLFTEAFNYVSDELGNIHIADVYTAFDNYYKETQDYSIIQSDGIHPSKEGHALIAQVILSVIDELEELGIVPKGTKYYYLLGDPDATGNVTISDATMIQKYLARLVIFKDSVVRMCADADLDGIVTVKDATAIQKHIAGLTPQSEIDTLIPYYPE